VLNAQVSSRSCKDSLLALAVFSPLSVVVSLPVCHSASSLGLSLMPRPPLRFVIEVCIYSPSDCPLYPYIYLSSARISSDVQSEYMNEKHDILLIYPTRHTHTITRIKKGTTVFHSTPPCRARQQLTISDTILSPYSTYIQSLSPNTSSSTLAEILILYCF
jgi:hypothetical protein